MTTTNDDGNATPPDSSTGNHADDTGGKTYTQAELDEILHSKLRGQGKRLSEYEAKLASYEAEQAKAKQKAEEAKRKQMEKDGDLKGQLELERAEKAKLEQLLAEKDGKLSSFKDRETARLEALCADNARRLKGLPKTLHDLAQDDDPDKMAVRLSRAEALAGGGDAVSVRGGGGRGGATVDPLQASYDAMNAAIDKRKRV